VWKEPVFPTHFGQYEVMSIVVVARSFTFPLFFLYVGTFFIACFQILRLIWNRHKIIGWQSSFLFQVALWSIFRAFFFLFIDPLNQIDAPWFPAALYWFPVDIEFSTFSLLVLYYARLSGKGEGKRKRRMEIMVYISVNVVFFIITLVAIVVTLLGSKDDLLGSTSWENRMWNILSLFFYNYCHNFLVSGPEKQRK